MLGKFIVKSWGTTDRQPAAPRGYAAADGAVIVIKPHWS